MMNNETKKRSVIVGTAIVVSLIIGSASTYYYSDQDDIQALIEKYEKELKTLDDVTTMYKAELVTVKGELEKYKGKNKKLEILINSAETEIAIREKKINELMNGNTSLNKLKKEVIELKLLNKKYLERLSQLENDKDNLVVDIETLTAENATLKKQLAALDSANQDLKKKIAVASVLKAENFSLSAERKTNSGKYKEVKLWRADRLMLSFDLAENKVAEPGNRIIFVRILDSRGKLVESRTSDFFRNSEKNVLIPYTTQKTVYYSNKKQRVNIPIEFRELDLDKDNYRLEFYCDGDFIGSGTTEIR